MHYPIHLVRINECLSLYLPIQGEIKAVYEKTLNRDPDTPFPFWARVWPSSTALTNYLSRKQALIKGKQILEIGAGTGVPSFSIAPLAGRVIISDHSAEAVELMNKNIGHLGSKNATALCLDWNHFPEQLEADVVLLSDINYSPGEFGPLLALTDRFIQAGAIIILATPQRIMGGSFVEQLSVYIQKQEELIADDTTISLFVLSKLPLINH